jgi:MFS family permease
MPTATVFGLPARQGRWGFVILGFLINLCMGGNFSWSVFRKPLEQDMHIGATQSGLPYTVFIGSFVLWVLISSKFIENIGPRMVTRLGALVIGAGWVLAGFSANITALTITFGLVASAGVGSVFGCPIALANKWFPDKKGLALGLTLAGYGLSPVVAAPIAGAIIQHHGPFVAFRVLGFGIMAVVFAASFLIKFPPADWEPSPTLPDALPAITTEAGYDTSRMLKTPAFYGLYFAYTFAAFIGPMAIGISSPVAQEIIKINPSSATLLVALFAICNGIGRVLLGWLTDRVTPRYAGALSFLLIFLASAGMLQAGPGDVLLFCACFGAFWMTMGGWIAVAPTANITFFGHRHQVKNYGVIFSAYGLGGVLGILISGMIKDRLGSYHYAFYPTAALSLMGLVISLLFLKKPAERI